MQFGLKKQFTVFLLPQKKYLCIFARVDMIEKLCSEAAPQFRMACLILNPRDWTQARRNRGVKDPILGWKCGNKWEIF